MSKEYEEDREVKKYKEDKEYKEYSITYLPKTADVRFRVVAKDLKSLFVGSVVAMIDVMVDHKRIEDNIKKEISVFADSVDKLLVRFLEEVLFLLDADGFLTGKVEDLTIEETSNGFLLNAVLLGDDVNKTSKYELSSGVKAVTYNDFVFKYDDEDKQYIVEVTLDV